ncbi:uncharacterized protein LOC111674514 [Lucilia cuprina]|uniref:uncharacterized protein LOC111674514 n=1 Tax=Lucilia cuprina TaxID=7375 RepID=UPI001F06628B|nr:uncharacterized protein LOC111674514 [Lucilia cuprina]
MLKLLVIIGLEFLANNAVKAQTQPTLCSNSPSMAFNVTQISGVWWEVARNPLLPTLACVKVNFTEIQPENVLQIATTNVVSNNYLWVNQTMYANISLATENSNGYNISYIDGISTTKYTVYKLLNTDYTSYALFCGYTNATNNATSFGLILTRERYPNTTLLNTIEDQASSLYSDFSFGTLPLVTQSPTCYAAGSGTYNIIFATIFSCLFVILISAI